MVSKRQRRSKQPPEKASIPRYQVVYIFRQLLKKIDSNKDNKLNQKELDSAVQRADLSLDEAWLLVVMKRWVEQMPLCITMARLANSYPADNSVQEQSRVLRELTSVALRASLLSMFKFARYFDESELEHVARIAANPVVADRSTHDALRLLMNRFNDIDRNRDKSVSRSELKQCKEMFATSPLEESLYDDLLEVFDEVLTLQRRSHSESAEITFSDLSSYRWERETSSKLYNFTQFHRNRIKDADHRLFGSVGKPDFRAVRQGFVGDCGLLATLANFAVQKPEVIHDMIVENADGSYTITFPMRRDQPVNVERPTMAEFMLYAGASEFGIWPAVLEKACGLVIHSERSRRPMGKLFKKRVPTENVDSTGRLLILKEDRIESIYARRDRQDELRQLIENANRKKLNVVVATLFKDRRVDDFRIPPRHAYALIGADPGCERIKVYNPHGFNQNVLADLWSSSIHLANDDGVLEMDLSYFAHTFDLMWIEKETAE